MTKKGSWGTFPASAMRRDRAVRLLAEWRNATNEIDHARA